MAWHGTASTKVFIGAQPSIPTLQEASHGLIVCLLPCRCFLRLLLLLLKLLHKGLQG